MGDLSDMVQAATSIPRARQQLTREGQELAHDMCLVQYGPPSDEWENVTLSEKPLPPPQVSPFRGEHDSLQTPDRTLALQRHRHHKHLPRISRMGLDENIPRGGEIKVIRTFLGSIPLPSFEHALLSKVFIR